MSPIDTTTTPRVFISYSHDSALHKTDVRKFAAFLRDQGIDAVLDAWLEGARQDWYAWVLREMSEVDYIVVVVSKRYRSIADGHGDETQHRGVQSEASILRELIYTDRSRWLPRILPVIFPGHSTDEIPLFLQPHTASFFPVTAFTVSGADSLLRVILRQPRHVAPPVAAHSAALSQQPNISVVAVEPGNVCLPVPRQLPLAVRDFVGRTDAMAALDAVGPLEKTPVDPAQVVIVEGMAGVGKTTLAVYWAQRVQNVFPDGTLFANLHGYGPGSPLEPVSVLVSFVRALGVAADRVPAELDILVGLYRSLVAGRRMLIVLDNAAIADQVRSLLPGSPGCLALITSRATLTGLIVAEAARRVALDPFTPGEAEDLVREIVGPQRVMAEPEAVVELVRLCARLPLAVRVAASRVAVRPHISITDLVKDIGDPQARLTMLSDAGDDGTALQAVLDWSYVRLPTRQARTFRHLGLHPSPEFDVRATAALTGLDLTDTHQELEALAEAHLIEPVDRTRYRFHDLVHVYAAHRAELDDSPSDRRRALASMVVWYAQTATTADRLVFPAHPALPVNLGVPVHPAPITDRAQAWSWLTSEHPTVLATLRHAADHHMHEATIALAGATRFLALQPRALWNDRLEAESRGLIAAEALGNRTTEAVFHRRRADTHQMMGHWMESDADLDRTVDLAREIDNSILYGEALCGLGRNRKLQHRYTEAQTCYLQALPLVRGSGSGYVEAVVECNLSQISARLGRYEDALEHARRELALRRTCGDAVGEAYALHNLAVAEQGLGNHDSTIELGERAVAIYRAAVAADQLLAGVLETVATSLDRTDDHVRAGQYLAEAATILTRSSDPRAEILHERMRNLPPTASPCAQ